jgi:hypothetical protein
LIECLNWCAARIGGGLEHQRRYRSNQHRLGHTFRALPADVTSHFATTGGVSDMDRILQVEHFDKCREIVGVGIQVVAVPGLARSAMAAAVMCDTAVEPRIGDSDSRAKTK